jgi:hypothetical protein
MLALAQLSRYLFERRPSNESDLDWRWEEIWRVYYTRVTTSDFIFVPGKKGKVYLLRAKSGVLGERRYSPSFFNPWH